MIDKQKLLDWISDKKYVYSVDPEYLDSSTEIDFCMGAIRVLNMLQQQVKLGEFTEEVAHERTTEISSSASRT